MLYLGSCEAVGIEAKGEEYISLGIFGVY